MKPTPKTENTRMHLTTEQIESLGTELDALRNEVVADLGERDAQHIRRIVRLARTSAITGRSLLMFGIDPISWTLGVGALATAKILENMEIGHNVMHGQYDWMNDPALDSQTYEWDNVCDSGHWRRYHNYEHHTFTNILGRDRDVGYGLLRVSPEQYWRPKHLVQPFSNVALAVLFQWGVGLHGLDLTRAFRRKEARAVLRREWRTFMRKAGRQVAKDYVLFPLLALGNAPRVFLGNLTANVIRNVWTNAIIFCGHFPEGARVYTEAETRQESRGAWYLRQLQGSANIEGSRLFHVLSGHLSHQIEHHLFPDLPAHRYAEIAPRVRAICAKYGLLYNTGSFWQQYGSVLAKLFRYALPWQTPTPVTA
jgi:NADPH-dependent stearoyl-CoA 9-desaturase